jgi:hypothetical protein
VNQLKGLNLDLFGKFANDDWRFQMDNFVVVHTNRPMPLKGDLVPTQPDCRNRYISRRPRYSLRLLLRLGSVLLHSAAMQDSVPIGGPVILVLPGQPRLKADQSLIAIL